MLTKFFKMVRKIFANFDTRESLYAWSSSETS